MNCHFFPLPDPPVSSNGETESWSASLDETEKLALEAIRCLHRQLDDDQDGNINLDESNDVSTLTLCYANPNLLLQVWNIPANIKLSFEYLPTYTIY